MRYKAYINNLNVANFKIGDKTEDFNVNSPIDEDDDLHVLQGRLQAKSRENGLGILYIQKIKIIDTFYEDKFNKKQEELKRQNTENVEQSLLVILQQFEGQESSPELLSKLKTMIAQSLSQNPLIGTKVGEGEVFIKHIDNNTYELVLPSYNITSIKFSL
jgi:hypothetical protein